MYTLVLNRCVTLGTEHSRVHFMLHSLNKKYFVVRFHCLFEHNITFWLRGCRHFALHRGLVLKTLNNIASLKRKIQHTDIHALYCVIHSCAFDICESSVNLW